MEEGDIPFRDGSFLEGGNNLMNYESNNQIPDDGKSCRNQGIWELCESMLQVLNTT